jgi:glycine cleavage system H protein
MSLDPTKLQYTSTHEWVHFEDAAGGSKLATVGISAFALEALTDLVHVELPETGRAVKAGQPFGEVESVKAVSDLYSPVDGEVVQVNSALTTPDPKTGIVNLDVLSHDPYDAGWLLKIRVTGGGKSDLMDYAAYKKQCEESAA